VTKAKISEYSATAGDNTDVNGTNIAEGCPPSGINDAIREVMAALKRFETGADGDSVTVGGNLVVSGSTTANTFTSTLINADNLSFDGNTISSTNTNGNIVLAPNGTGDVQVDADTLRVGDSGADATIQSNGNADLILKTGNATTGTVTLADGANGNLTVALNGTGQVVVNAGAVGTPTIAPTGDLNTGIFFPAADTIAFAEGGAEAMRIDSDGDVGIGTTSPAVKLSVESATGGGVSGANPGGDTVRITQTPVFGSGGFVAQRLFLNKSSTANDGVTQSFDCLAVGGDRYTMANIGGYIDNAGSGNSVSGYFTISTKPSNASITERARITSGGYFKASNDGNYVTAQSYHELRTTTQDQYVVLLTNANATSPYGPNIYFSGVTPNNTTNYFLNCQDTTNDKLTIYSSGTVTNRTGTYNSYSDIKLKQDIVDASSQWDDIKALRVVKYRLKDEVAADPNYPAYIGLIAQEVEQVSAGLVDDCPDFENVEVPVLDDDGNPVLDEEGNPQVKTERQATGTTTKAVKYSILYMKAVKALQEAMERIETLEAKVSALEAK